MGRMRGKIAVRVGWLTAKNACCTEYAPSSSHTLVLPAADSPQNNTVDSVSPEVVTMSTVRLSKASAMEPP